mmetsp:Transcript_1644/g.5067  ORF Transcript_1644/g.5067 Transcript_1644/m.5067 type:complete len:452 (-) Transcript_1644:103-1458(-)
MSKVCVPPNPNYIAEVVVLLTSLGAKRSELNAGRLACDILEVKRAHRKVIDLNMDARAGLENGEDQAIERLEARNEAVRNEAGELPLPQIFVDGSYVGSTETLQALEDDGLLGRILRRQLCLRCHQRKASDSMTCPSCGAMFEEVLPNNMTIQEELRRYYGKYSREDQDEEDTDSGSEAGERLTAYESALEVPLVPARPPAWERAKKAATAKAAARLRGRSKMATDSWFEEMPSDSWQQNWEETEGWSNSWPDSYDATPDATPAAVADNETVHEAAVPGTTSPKAASSAAAPTPLPELQGHVWKKSPNQLRLFSYEKRYFVLRDMQFCWWKSKNDALSDGTAGRGKLCKGFIDMTAGPVEVQLMLGNESTFSLRPPNGTWAPGAIAKGDSGREFTLDVTNLEHSRDTWVGAIREHIIRAKQVAPKSVSSVAADLSFYKAVGLPAPDGGFHK